MTTKESILQLFSLKKGQFLSGEEIAEKLKITRSAVWKNVKLLKEEGYQINSITNKGYCLLEENDVLSENSIKNYLKNDDIPLKIEILNTVDSTNKYVKNRANQGEQSWFMAIAKEQTLGKGRMKRSFYSPKESGIYMSLLLRPDNFYSNEIYKITAISGLSMCKAIEKFSLSNAEIKWVNDIFINGKKVCGILTESSLELESGFVEYLVVGIGVNLYKPENDFPNDLKDVAGYIFNEQKPDIKNKIIAEFLNNFINYYNQNNDNYMDEYVSRNFLKGKKVTVVSGNEKQNVLVEEIDKKCCLIAKTNDGKIEKFSSGDVSIKL